MAGTSALAGRRRRRWLVAALLTILFSVTTSRSNGMHLGIDPPVRETLKPIYEVRLPRDRAIPRVRAGRSDSTSSGPTVKNADRMFDESLIEDMVTARGQRMRCKLPVKTCSVEDDKNLRSTDPSKEAMGLLASMENKCFSSIARNEWWSYQLCRQREVVQEHKAKNSQEKAARFSLGKYDPHAEPEYRQRVWEDEHLYSEVYTEGSPCDITNKARKTYVKYLCSSSTYSSSSGNRRYIHAINELRSCVYEVLFVSELICNHSWYQDKLQRETLKIECELEEEEGEFLGLGFPETRSTVWI
eukprot:Plantae.Rhodophyta-Purpureofilum_apyrenoidigerum.ctg5418.p1 GENE.Plantae.Rhodophyta-Purpureofilum_apyrenoidigerum.ctg5418~~Plantae.Rhodophyta-Purpureofilum_apyrenoidigerum.ctg5418.p1  ORF type:complete len:301 (-),score=32.54 Plantae.Rhodophyta-Purpureofilum_apyrenoidigerum.ctg5418:339-1241(-)